MSVFDGNVFDIGAFDVGAIQPPAQEETRSKGGWDPYYYKKRKKPVSVGPIDKDWTPPVPRPALPPTGPYVPQGWASNVALIPWRPQKIDWAAIEARQEQDRLTAIAAQRAREEEDDEEIMLLLAA